MLRFQVIGKITEEGVFLEQLETDPSSYLPDVTDDQLGGDVVKVLLTSINDDSAITVVYLLLKNHTFLTELIVYHHL